MSEHWLQELSAFLCQVMAETVRKLKVKTKEISSERVR